MCFALPQTLKPALLLYLAHFKAMVSFIEVIPLSNTLIANQPLLILSHGRFRSYTQEHNIRPI